jgi:thiamine monophosphate synthase
VREDWGQVAMISIEMDGFSSEKAMREYICAIARSKYSEHDHYRFVHEICIMNVETILLRVKSVHSIQRIEPHVNKVREVCRGTSRNSPQSLNHDVSFPGL